MTQAIERANPNNATFVTRFATGAGHLFWGVKMTLTQPSLFLLSMAVIGVNLFVYCALFGVVFYFSRDMTHYVAVQFPAVFRWDWMETVAVVMLNIIWALAAIFVAVGIASALTGPLLDKLSERTESLLTNDVNPPPFTVRSFIVEMISWVGITARSIGLGLTATVALCWIPVVGQVVPFCIAAVFVALSFIQPTAIRHGLKTRERIQMLSRNKALLLGFGAPCNVFPFLLVPLMTPALVVGGTRLFLSLAAHQRVPNIATENQLNSLLGESKRSRVAKATTTPSAPDKKCLPE